MKTTIDIPEDLYRRVKAKSALEGRAVREVTIELYRQWLESSAASASTGTPAERLEAWFGAADAALNDAPPGPTAREILQEDRNRLEPR
jgi:hypothetical protein